MRSRSQRAYRFLGRVETLNSFATLIIAGPNSLIVIYSCMYVYPDTHCNSADLLLMWFNKHILFIYL